MGAVGVLLAAVKGGICWHYLTAADQMAKVYYLRQAEEDLASSIILCA